MSVPCLVSFVLNPQINSVKTPDMLKLWGSLNTHIVHYAASNNVPYHISYRTVSMRSLKSGTRGHDSVLANIEISLRALLDGSNILGGNTTFL